MNIDKFESIIKAKLLEKDETPALIEIDDYSQWQEGDKKKLEVLLTSLNSRLIMVSCGPGYEADSKKFKKMATQAYLKKYSF